MPDASAAKQGKKRACNLNITVLEGNPTLRDLEQESNEYLGTSWRCTTRPINRNQFTMRLSNPKEVESLFFLVNVWK
jgi:hypothetical protein